jgi:hypothetical protein
MKDIFVWFCVAFIAACACIVSYRYGVAVGQSNGPVKYAICDNGTCVLSDVPPDVYYQNK